MVNNVTEQEIITSISDKLSFQIGDIVFLNLIYALILLVAGFFIARLISSAIQKGIAKSGADRKMQKSFLELLVAFIRWSIYILFVNWALNILYVPHITDGITNILVVFPAFVGALLIIILGFAMAVYLRGIIEDSEVEGWQILSLVVFYFVFYTFFIFGFRTMMRTIMTAEIVNNLILYLSLIIGAGITYVHVKNK
jgi:hypothetical protein